MIDSEAVIKLQRRMVHAVVAECALLSDAMRGVVLMPSGPGDPPAGNGLGVDVLPGDAPDSRVYSHSGAD